MAKSQHLVPKQKHPATKIQESLRTRFIRLSRLSNDLIDKFLYLTLLVTYLQTFFVTIHLSKKYLPDSLGPISEVMRLCEDFFMINLFNYTSDSQKLAITFSCVIFYFVIHILCLLVNIYQSFLMKKSILFLSKAWAVLIRLHFLVLFLPINNLCIYLQSQAKKQIVFDSSQTSVNDMMYYCSIVLMIGNFLFAVLPYNFLFDLLPSKNSMSSKNYYTPQTTLLQSLIVPLFTEILPGNTTVRLLILFLNFGFSLARYWNYLYVLPKYHYKTLALGLYLNHQCCLASGLALLIVSLNTFIPECNINFERFILIMFTLCPLLFAYSTKSLQKILKNIIIASYKQLNPYKALHKIFALKYIEKCIKLPTKRQSRFSVSYFYMSLMKSRMNEVFSQQIYLKEKSIDFDDKSQRNQIIRVFLEEIVKYFSSCELLRLLLVNFYIKNFKCYLLAVKTLAQKKFHSFNAQLSADLLHYQIQEIILNQSHIESEGLSLGEFIETKRKMDLFKERIRQQLSCHTNFWREYTRDNPDVYQLQKLSEDNEQYSKLVEKKWSKLIQNKLLRFPNYLYLLNAPYHLLLNGSLLKAEQSLDKYNRLKYQRKHYPKHKSLFSSNLFERLSTTFSITIQTDSEKMGTIIDCSKSIEKALEYKITDIIGSNLGIIMSPYIADRHNGFIQEYIKTGESFFIGKPVSVFVKNREGFLQKCSLFVNIHPFIDKEVYITGLLGPIQSPFEYILLTPEGEIDSYTEKIALDLGLTNKRTHINRVCPTFTKLIDRGGLERIITRFHSREKSVYTDAQHSDTPFSEDPSYSTHRVLLSNKNPFTTYRNMRKRSEIDSPKNHVTTEEFGVIEERHLMEGCNLEFIPLSPNLGNPKNSFLYGCKFSSVPVKSSFMKVLELQPLDKKIEHSDSWVQTHKDKETVFSSRFPDQPEYEEEEKSRKNSRNFTVDNRLKPSLVGVNPNEPKVTADIRVISESERSRSKEHMDESKLSKQFLNENKKRPNVKKGTRTTHIIQQRILNSNSSGSLSSSERKIQLHMEDTVGTKHSSKTARGFLFGFLSIVLIIAGLQIHFWISANKSLNNMNALIRTLYFANTRADSFALLNRYTVACSFLNSGIVIRNSTLGNSVVNGFTTTFRNTFPILKSSNFDLILAVNEIDNILQDYFKAENIRIYEINSNLTRSTFQNHSTFSAINLLIQKFLVVAENFFEKGFFDPEDLTYLLVNSMNDLLIETINAVSVVFKEVQLSIDSALIIFQSNMTVFISVLVILLFANLFFTYWAYDSEIKLTQACLGISARDIKPIQNILTTFEKMIESEDVEDLYTFYKDNMYAYKTMLTHNHNSKDLTKPLRTKMVKVQYLKKVLVFILILITYIIFILFAFEDMMSKVDNLWVKAQRLARSQSLQSELSLITLSLEQMVIQNKDIHVRNRLPEEDLEITLDNFFTNINNLLDVFQNQDGTVDAKFAPIFFGNGCDFISPSVKFYCLDILKDSQVFGLFSFLNRHYSLSKSIFESFSASNKSLAIQQKLVSDILLTLGTNSYFLRELLAVTIQRVKNDLLDDLDGVITILDQRIIINLLLDSLMCLLTWKLLIRYDVDFLKRFKRKVKLIPVSLVLQDPVLKGILINLSKGKLSI